MVHFLGKIVRFIGTSLLVVLVGGALLFYGGKVALFYYGEHWADKLISLDKQGLLSQSFGAAWQDVVYSDSLASTMGGLRKGDKLTTTVTIVDGVPVEDYPSLDVVRRLNEVKLYSNEIKIEDRRGQLIASIMTDHRRAPYEFFPKTLVEAVVASEDAAFFENERGYSYESFVRASLVAAQESVMRGSFVTPVGTSSITQQVGKMLVSQLDTEGRRYVSRSLDRKLREVQIAAALRKLYSAEDIMEVYLNHCLTSSYGLVGVTDIAMGLWGKPVEKINDAEAVYLSRMVKWGMNFEDKIKKQCHIDMPRIQKRLGWSDAKTAQVLRDIDALTFLAPTTITAQEGYLVDLANIYWQKFLALRGVPQEQLQDFDLLNPASLIRQKGNMTIRMSIDMPLQKALVAAVDQRGFGGDTTIMTDVRIGSEGRDVPSTYGKMVDTLRILKVLKESYTFSEPDGKVKTTLQAGDTLITNIRYGRNSSGSYRRSLYFYARKPVAVTGQYFAYAMMESKSGKLRAYYSRDKLGSRGAGLLSRPTPNGSSLVKPLINALMYDLGIYKPWSRWSDMVSPGDPSLPWFWTLHVFGEKKGEARFRYTSVPGVRYPVHNFKYKLEGSRYVYEQLALSNNILAVENMYRLNAMVFDSAGLVTPQGGATAALLYRLGLYESMREKFAGKIITGPRIFKEIARIVGASVDTVTTGSRKTPISDSLYSMALGTIELTLLQQMHLFNVLHNNMLIEKPQDHPSLFLDQVVIMGDTFTVDSLDPVVQYHPFASIDNIRPSLLALHKRLTDTYGDGLAPYDIELLKPEALPVDTLTEEGVPPATPAVVTPPSLLGCFPAQGYANFAKSGTTDDILRPYNSDASSTKRTNYGLWNAVIRIDLAKLDTTPLASDIQDITIACIAEANSKNTGLTDGKSIHKFITIDLLTKAGQKVPPKEGFFHVYESTIRSGRAYQEYMAQERMMESDTTSTPYTEVAPTGEVAGYDEF